LHVWYPNNSGRKYVVFIALRIRHWDNLVWLGSLKSDKAPRDYRCTSILKKSKVNFLTIIYHSGVPQGSVLDPLLYLLYTSNLLYSSNTTTATFADDTAVLALDPNPTIASQKLQNSLDAIQQ
jgi:hypothetical protein